MICQLRSRRGTQTRNRSLHFSVVTRMIEVCTGCLKKKKKPKTQPGDCQRILEDRDLNLVTKEAKVKFTRQKLDTW